jgi:hypothetical protein
MNWRRNTLAEKHNHRHEHSGWGESRFIEPDELGVEVARRDLPQIRPPVGWKPSGGYRDRSRFGLVARIVALVVVIVGIVAVALGARS